ncbi:EthD domain-containing protein [Aestuariirhabdus sp. Z084]|uniref:EthD domain-containing protein n=1 Tax=Aestuariirhabdus haliotis TaxID=2918751 RepID=UPI00201B35BD|nr:EthD domain-containing protein [Aestuariirhabdus haliotis]MCL6415220.1 EthD domain-containing protein [Aestuariirhabdus haliotis]MCL6419480.1 EthD domain-containing protein [Aestuariirhabdus haliotis]
MIKQVMCFRRKAGVSDIELRNYWNNEFDQFIRDAGNTLNCCRAAKSLTLQVEENDKLQQRQHFEAPYDGVVEFWFEKPREAFEITSSDQWIQLITELKQNPHFLLDTSRSTSFYVDESIIIDSE